MELNIEQFNPTKAELIKLADKYKGLEIVNIEDKAGYLIVDEARKDLKTKRVLIKKTGKALRDDANKFAKTVIAMEKDLIEMIAPLEKELQEKLVVIDNEKLKIKQQELLPERRKQLNKIGVEISDDEILLMDDKKYNEFYTEQNALYLEKKELELQAKEDEIARAEEIKEAAKQATLEAERIAKEREAQLKRDAEEAAKQAELDKQNAIEAERIAKEREAQLKRDAEEAAKQAELDKQNAIEAERIKIQKEKADLEKAEQLEKEKVEKNKKYRSWLKSNGVDQNDESIIIKREENTFKLYKLIDEITL